MNLSEQTPTYLQQAFRQRISQTQQPARCATGLSQLTRLTSGQTGFNDRHASDDMSVASPQQQTQPTKRVVPVFRPNIHKQQSGVVAFRPYSEVKPKTVLTFQAAKPTSSTASTIGCSQIGTPTQHSSQMDVDCIPPTQYTAANSHLVPPTNNGSSVKKPVFLKTPNRPYSNTNSGIKPTSHSGLMFAKKLSEMTSMSNVNLSHNTTGQTSQTPVRANMPHFAASSVKRKLDVSSFTIAQRCYCNLEHS